MVVFCHDFMRTPESSSNSTDILTFLLQLEIKYRILKKDMPDERYFKAKKGTRLKTYMFPWKIKVNRRLIKFDIQEGAIKVSESSPYSTL
jgi:hypothetical protein